MTSRRPGALAIASALLLLPVHTHAAEDASVPAPALEALGARLEEARALPAVERGPAYDAILRAIADAGKSLPSESKAPAALLSAEVRFATGDAAHARQDYESAGKSFSKGPFADDAAFGAIRALEAANNDVGAAKEWSRWLDKYPTSPLHAEALLASAWNAVRRDSLRTAATLLDQLHKEAPWMQADSRVVLARATVAYLDGRPVDALAALGDDSSTAAAEYLRALSLRAKGEVLPAAARFQNVAQRWPDSTLRDPALLAKADVFLESGAWRSAVEEFGRVAEAAHRDDVRAEAELRRAAAVMLAGDFDAGVDALRQVVSAHGNTTVAARAQYLLGEALFTQKRYEEAIGEYNRVLTTYFDHDLAARGQYQVGRCLDALGRSAEATSAYQAVVAGYSQSPEAPAAAYLAGVGLLESNRPVVAAPYFRLVLDRYARETEGALVFADPTHFELVEAALCLLELSYHRAGDLGQLCGVPHLMLAKMPKSDSAWRAWALLIDADGLASLGRYDETQAVLDKLMQEFPEHEAGIAANRLLAWTQARQGHDELAIATEARMLARYTAAGDQESLGSAVLHRGHILFNEKKYKAAAASYDEFTSHFPNDKQVPLALYQSGLCHLRLDHAGDAVDRWQAAVARDPSSDIGAKAWARAGDVYFRAEKYDDAKRCYAGLLEHVPAGPTTARATLRIAQCEYNAGHDPEALRGFADVIDHFAGTPSAKEAEHGLELTLYRLGRAPEGAKVLAELVERFPTSSFAADAQFQIAMRSYETKDWPHAAEAFRRVVTQFPSYSAADRAAYLMADSYQKAGATREAREACEQFLHFFPESEFRPVVQFGLGSARFAEGDYTQAALDFMAVLDSKVSSETAQAAQYNLALCQIQLGRTEEAKATLAQFRAKQAPGDPRTADVAYRLGDLHERAGNAKEAIAEYEKALGAKPGADLTGELQYRIGTCRETLTDSDGALRAYRAAVAVAPRGNAYRLSALGRLAALYEARDRLTEAVKIYRELIADSNDPELVGAAKERVAQLEAVKKRR